jgi:alkyl sulfatase BDS1-like metallo-beta-lactamase superfamily hydrolase
MIHLLFRAKTERDTLGYIEDATLTSLINAGYTLAEIERSLALMENLYAERNR